MSLNDDDDAFTPAHHRNFSTPAGMAAKTPKRHRKSSLMAWTRGSVDHGVLGMPDTGGHREASPKTAALGLEVVMQVHPERLGERRSLGLSTRPSETDSKSTAP